MPHYTFEDKSTGETSNFVMSISELDKFKEDNPNLEQILSAIGIADPTRVRGNF